jgi:hypothetical protein
MIEVRDLTKLFEGIPADAWVALSHDQERVVAYDADIMKALQMAKAAGERNPVIMGVPDPDSIPFL